MYKRRRTTCRAWQRKQGNLYVNLYKPGINVQFCHLRSIDLTKEKYENNIFSFIVENKPALFRELQKEYYLDKNYYRTAEKGSNWTHRFSGKGSATYGSSGNDDGTIIYASIGKSRRLEVEWNNGAIS